MNRLKNMLLPLLAALLLSGCSALQLTYNNAPTVARFMAGDYIDFESAQADEFKSRFARYHEWHRRQELPVYVGFLNTAAARIETGLKEEDVRWAMNTLRDRYRLAAARAAMEAAPMLAAMSPAQLAHMEKALAEKNAKYEKENISAEPRKVLRKRIVRIEDYFKDWMGSLSRPQEQRIERFAAGQGELVTLRFSERKRWQQQALAAIRSHRDPAALAAALTEMFERPEKDRPPAVEQALERYNESIVKLVMEMDRDLSPEQRVKTVRRMHKYAADLTELARVEKG